jgi:CheY-like chemotaxis protein
MDLADKRSVRALVVDDQADCVYVLVRLLRQFDCEAHGYKDGRSALAAAASIRPDLMLLDWSMPGMDGLETAMALREQALTPPLLVALSGYGTEKVKADCLEAGCHCHELKPISASRLRELVAEARRRAYEQRVRRADRGLCAI